MDIGTTSLSRRALLAAIAGGSVVAGTLAPVRGYLQDFAPLSGEVWRAADTGRRDLESPYGPATVRYDEWGVPHIEADDEGALFYATGYAQAADRLFQLDLQRRVMRGRLSEVVGDATIDSDEFNRRMGFTEAAEVTWDAVDGPAREAAIAFAAGVNASIEDGPLPPEFALLDYEPREWTPVDTVLMEKQISWNLTGSFRTLRHARLREALDAETYETLYPSRLDHDASIIRDGDGGLPEPESRAEDVDAPPAALTDWVGQFETEPWVGSNSWGVRGDHTDTGRALVANDPHLSLMAPPVWYELHLAGPNFDARGVTFPGVPFVVIGGNTHGAWGFTNVGADVLDVYRYETREGQYRYRGAWRDYETTEETIPVAGGEDVTITRRRTVHGPVLEREGYEVAVAWTGHGPTRTTDAIYAYNASEGIDDVREATRLFDEPTQNLVYGDEDGNLLYYTTGAIPVRRTDGEMVRGDRVFDGSAGEGEWAGFVPFESADWEGEGFVPFEEKPHLDNPAYVATANQRVVDDPDYYLAEAYSDPYRGIRIYDRMDARARSGEPFTRGFARGLQRDTVDLRAVGLLDDLVAAAADREELVDWVDALADWDQRMSRDAEAALAFAFFVDAYRKRVASPVLESAGLDPDDESLYPRMWVVQQLDEDHPVFAGRDREAVLVAALEDAVETIEEQGYETYGDYNTTGAITHPFDQSFLNYPAYPTDGSPATVNNYRRGDPDNSSIAGSSWRMVVDAGAEGDCVLPGGNDGVFLSDHYHDQLRLWAAGEFKPLSLELVGDVRYTFGGADE
ncbi:penicillin acylase family protein [Natronomonas sp. EA1]|uniref:penicillin acylase family protein n=1 Tax=Natronomonas sp. EA1 TaxID=3421655 RepID=UPI003EBA1E17